MRDGRLTPDDILGDAASLWRTTMDNLHAFARATKCPLGYDVIRWFGEEVARLQNAMSEGARNEDSTTREAQ
jgi:hypothetical protein